MNLVLRIPDGLAARFGSPGEIERRALEALALEEFRLGRLSRPEIKPLWISPRGPNWMHSLSAMASSAATVPRISTGIGPTLQRLGL